MKLGGEVFPAFQPYNKPTYEIHVSGCTRNCKGCHNYALHDFNYGEEINLNEYFKKLKKRAKLYEAVCIMGGDLLCQDTIEAMDFVKMLKVTLSNKELWLFTGEDDINSIPRWAKETFDYIKIGHYDEDLKQEGFPASSNQKLLQMGVDY